MTSDEVPSVDVAIVMTIVLQIVIIVALEYKRMKIRKVDLNESIEEVLHKTGSDCQMSQLLQHDRLDVLHLAQLMIHFLREKHRIINKTVTFFSKIIVCIEFFCNDQEESLSQKSPPANLKIISILIQ